MKKIIMSLDTAERSRPKSEYETMRAHLETSGMLVQNGITVENGQTKPSLICFTTTPLHERMVRAVAQAYRQPTVLEISENRGYLFNPETLREKFVGIWTAMGPDVTGDFTLDTETMIVYKCI